MYLQSISDIVTLFASVLSLDTVVLFLTRYADVGGKSLNVWYDRFDWRAALREVMTELESVDPQCVLLCSDAAVYEAHLQLLGESVPLRMVIQERVGPLRGGRTLSDVSKTSENRK